MTHFLTYIRQRFPITPALIFSVLFAYAGMAYGLDAAPQPLHVAVPALVLFLFLLRLRLWDDIKDAKYDAQNHADRPIPKGLLTHHTLGTLALGVLALELALQLTQASHTFLLFLATILYSVLMYKEFFAPQVLKKSLLLYSLSHQIIFVFYTIYFISLSHTKLFVPRTPTDFLVILSLAAIPFIYEIGRKCRHRTDTDGNKTNDTYIYQWGAVRSFSALIVLFAICFATIYHLTQTVTLGLLIAVICLAGAISIFFLRQSRVLETAPIWSMALGIYTLILLIAAIL